MSTPWMQAYLESIVCKFGGDPTICLREVMVSANSVHCVHCGQIDCNTSLPPAGEVKMYFWASAFAPWLLTSMISLNRLSSTSQYKTQNETERFKWVHVRRDGVQSRGSVACGRCPAEVFRTSLSHSVLTVPSKKSTTTMKLYPTTSSHFSVAYTSIKWSNETNSQLTPL